MRCRTLDENGDIVTSGNQFSYDARAIALKITTSINLIAGEYFRDVRRGTRMFEYVVGAKAYSNNARDSEIKFVIRRTPGVRAITYFKSETDADTRAYKATVTVLTIFGELTIPLG